MAKISKESLSFQTSIQFCSLSARGLLFEMKKIMAMASPIGWLNTPLGKTVTLSMLVNYVSGGVGQDEIHRLLIEIENNGLLVKDEEGRWYSPEMLRAEEIREKRRQAGLKGGNPALMKIKKKLPLSMSGQEESCPKPVYGVSAMPDCFTETSYPPFIKPSFSATETIVQQPTQPEVATQPVEFVEQPFTLSAYDPQETISLCSAPGISHTPTTDKEGASSKQTRSVAAKKSSDKKSRMTQMPKDFEQKEPTPSQVEFCNEAGIDIANERLRFVDFHLSKGSVFADWDRAFWTWIRNSAEKTYATKAYASPVRQSNPVDDSMQGIHQKAAIEIMINNGVPSTMLNDFLVLRTSKKAALTVTAAEQLLEEIRKSGKAPKAVIAECCARGWTGFNASWSVNQTTIDVNGNELGRPLNKQEQLEVRNLEIGKRAAAKWLRDLGFQEDGITPLYQNDHGAYV